jgi:hypothetical protein
MQRRQFVGSGLVLAATWPLRGFPSVLKDVGDVPARSLAGGETVLPGSAIEALAASLRGEVLLADSQDYDRTRRVWNASFNKKPALIARCTGASDVQQAVAFAREHQLLTAVRAGGHSYSGKSSCDGGLMIDLQPMQGARVDPETKRAYLGRVRSSGSSTMNAPPSGWPPLRAPSRTRAPRASHSAVASAGSAGATGSPAIMPPPSIS